MNFSREFKNEFYKCKIKYKMNGKKICITGCSGVGKTTLCKFLRSNRFETKHVQTMGCDVHHINGKSLWDTAGDEKYGGLRDAYLIGNYYVIIMYDSSDSKTIEGMAKYVNEAISHNVPIILCGNKSDKGCISFEVEHAIKHFHTSLLTGLGVEEFRQYIINL